MKLSKLVGAWFLLAVVFSVVTPGVAQEYTLSNTGGQWFTAWGAPQSNVAPTTLSDQTVRMIARSTLAGDSVRVKLENLYGMAPVTIGAAFVGIRAKGARLAPGSNRPLTFLGLSSVTIAAGCGLYSDAVDLKVAAFEDLAVSLYVPGKEVPISRHAQGLTTSYRTDPMAGNHAGEESGAAFTNTTTTMDWLRFDMR